MCAWVLCGSGAKGWMVALMGRWAGGLVDGRMAYAAHEGHRGVASRRLRLPSTAAAQPFLGAAVSSRL